MRADSPPESVRPLGPVETYFWLADQVSPKQFVAAAEISGTTSEAQWREAIAALQARHPLLRVGIQVDANGRPHFVDRSDLALPLVITSSTSPARWDEIMEEELATPIPVDGRLMRLTVLLGRDASTVLLTMHHTIADGISSALLVRDLMAALSGETLAPLEAPLPQEDLLVWSAQEQTGEAAAPAPGRPGRRATRDRSRLKIDRVRLPPELGQAVRARARAENTTVHGALVAALILAGRRSAQAWSEAPVRVVSPVNARSALGRGDDCAVSIIFPITAHDAGPETDLWDVAREIPQKLAPARSADGLAAAFAAMSGLIDSRPSVADLDQIELMMCASEMMVSNLGALPFPARHGALRLAAFWGPSVLIGLEGEQMVGVATVDDAIHLLNSSFRPIPGLLEGAADILRFAVAPPAA